MLTKSAPPVTATFPVPESPTDGYVPESHVAGLFGETSPEDVMLAELVARLANKRLIDALQDREAMIVVLMIVEHSVFSAVHKLASQPKSAPRPRGDGVHFLVCHPAPAP